MDLLKERAEREYTSPCRQLEWHVDTSHRLLQKIKALLKTFITLLMAPSLLLLFVELTYFLHSIMDIFIFTPWVSNCYPYVCGLIMD